MDTNGKLGFNEQDYQLLSEKERDSNKALDNKVDKVTQGEAGITLLYGVNANGEQVMSRAITSSTPATIVRRTDAGTVIARDPTLVNELTTKKYVDDAIAALRAELTK